MSDTREIPVVLLVDDDEPGHGSCAPMLREAGYDVREVATLNEVPAALVRSSPEVAILDIDLPGLRGQKVGEAVGRYPRLAHVPTVLLSADFPSGTIAAGGWADGAEAYLAKPVAPHVLLATVAAVRRTGQLHRELARARQAAELRALELEAVFAAAPSPIIVYDADGVPVAANPAAHAAWGFDPTKTDRLAAAARLRLRVPQGRRLGPTQLPTSRALAGTRVERERYCFTDAKGEEHTALQSVTPLRADGQVRGAVEVWHDITEQERAAQEYAGAYEARQTSNEELEVAYEELQVAQEQLLHEQTRLRTLLAALPVGVTIAEDPACRVITGNARAAELYESTGRNLSVSAPPTERVRNRYLVQGELVPAEQMPMEQAVLGDRVVEGVELDVYTESGAHRLLRVNAAPVHDADGAVVGGIAVSADITAPREAEQAARESEARYRELVQRANSAIIRWRRDGAITFFNEYAEEFFGYREEEVLGQDVRILLPETESTGADLRALADDVLARPQAYEHNVNENLRRDGRRAWMAWTNRAIRDAQGGVAEILAVGTDITARVEAEAARRESEARHRSLFENMLDGYAYCRMLYEDGVPQDFLYLGVNGAFEKLTGLKDVVGKRVSEVIPTLRETNPEILERYGRVARGGQPERFEVYLEMLEMWLSIAVYSPAAEHFVAVFDNITARKRAEQERERLLQEFGRQARLLDTIVENTEAHLAYLDRDFHFLRVNTTYAAGSGHRKEDLLGRGHFELFPNEENERIFARVRDTGEPFEVREKPFEYLDQPERGVTYWDWTLVPMKNSANVVEGLVFSLMDVTEQVRQRERLVAAERARAEIAEHLSDEIAHRVKNNLAMISGLLQMQLLSETDQRPEAAGALREAIGRIRTFATLHERMYASHGEEVDLREVLEQICAATKEVFAVREDVDIVTHGDSFPCHSRVATNLSVVANELITNALKYGGAGQTERLEVRVGLQRRADEVRLSVWNSGNPVPASFEAGRQQTMGLRLVWDMDCGQYRGRFALRPEGGGMLAEAVMTLEGLYIDARPR